jgi:hypothetical protein
MYELYSAASDVPFVAKLLSNERLKVQALFVDKVSAVRPYISSSKWDSSFPTLDSVLGMDGKKRLATDEYRRGVTRADAHRRTICGNLIHEGGEFKKAEPEDKMKLERNQALYIRDNMQFLNHREDGEYFNRSAMSHKAVTGA